MWNLVFSALKMATPPPRVLVVQGAPQSNTYLRLTTTTSSPRTTWTTISATPALEQQRTTNQRPWTGSLKGPRLAVDKVAVLGWWQTRWMPWLLSPRGTYMTSPSNNHTTTWPSGGPRLPSRPQMVLEIADKSTHMRWDSEIKTRLHFHNLLDIWRYDAVF